MTADLTAGHAKARALVSFPAQAGTGRAIGRLFAVGGRKHSDRCCRIMLPSGAVVNRRLEDVQLVPEPPRVLP